MPTRHISTDIAHAACFHAHMYFWAWTWTRPRPPCLDNHLEARARRHQTAISVNWVCLGHLEDRVVTKVGGHQSLSKSLH